MLIENNKPLFSIIIPTYQRAHLIWKTLDSIVAQTYSNWECIVVDDGSTDNTKEIINSYAFKDSRFQYFSRPKNLLKGANSCRNFGYEKSRGVYVKWFDSDDIMLEDCLSSTIALFIESNCDLVVSDIEFIDINGLALNKKHKYFSSNLIEDYLLGKITYYTFIPTWNREFLNLQTQFFDEHITNLDDWDFNLRMLYQYPRVQYIHKPLIHYRVHPESLAHEISKLNYKEICSEIRAREKHLKILKLNKLVNSQILNEYIKNRYRYFFIHAMQMKDENRIKYFRMLLKKQFELKDFLGILKTIFAFCMYFSFNMGYFFLRKI